MGREKALAEALQLQHDASLIMSNIQVLGQFITSLNQMASEGGGGGGDTGSGRWEIGGKKNVGDGDWE